VLAAATLPLAAGAALLPGSAAAHPAARPAAPATPVASLYPSPGTPTASPLSEVSLRGVRPDQVGRLQVTGSGSGAHDGTLANHRDGAGVSFLPRVPFAPGERVTVTAGVRGGGGGGATASFTVARPTTTRDSAFPPGPTSTGDADVARSRTRPDLQPSRLRVVTPASGPARAAAGVLAATPRGGRQAGPELLDDRGQVVWTKPLPPGTIAMALRAQTLGGRPVLTWWEGTILTPGRGTGEWVIADQSYREVARVRAGNGLPTDFHDFRLTDRGTALVTSYNPVSYDLRSIGGASDSPTLDGVLQEVDVATGRVQFEWHSLGAIGLDESYAPVPKGGGQFYDHSHPNSFTPDGGGAYLVSLRSTHGVISLDRTTAGIRWRLGGTRSSYRLGPGVPFSSQHDAARQADGSISMFDNAVGVGPGTGKLSRFLQLRLDDGSHIATRVRDLLPRAEASSSPNQGDGNVLPAGHVLVGWGSEPAYTEYDGSGRVVLDVRWPSQVQSYRVERIRWSGQPDRLPDVVVTRGAGDAITAYASWNGATAVAHWQVLAGPSTSALRIVRTIDRLGFETAIPARAGGGVVVVRALDARGRVLGAAPPVPLR